MNVCREFDSPNAGLSPSTWRVALWLGAFLLLLSAGWPSYAQGCLRWVQRTDVGSPGQRYAHSMAYDSASGITYFFGGQYSEVGEDPEFFNDLWAYDGVQWRQVVTTGGPPSPRSWASMSADKGEIMLGQGIGDNGIEEVMWKLTLSGDGTGRWEPLSLGGLILRPRGYFGYGGVKDKLGNGRIESIDQVETPGAFPNLPTPVADFAGVEVSSLGRFTTLLLGGGQLSDADPLDDSTLIPGPLVEWVLQTRRPIGNDPSTKEFWLPLSCGPSPPNRYQHAAAYDSTRDRVVMFGGARVSGADRHWELARAPDGECWVWKQVNTLVTPEGRAHATMVYDAKRRVTILFGGIGGPQFTRFGDTWELTQVPPTLYQTGSTNFESCEGQPFSLYTSIAGVEPYQIQWFSRQVDAVNSLSDDDCESHCYELTGETNAVLTTYRLAGIHRFWYTVRDACDNVSTSVTYQATVHSRPSVDIFDREEACPGSPVRLSATISSTLPATLQWYRDGRPVGAPRNFLPGKHTDHLEITNVQSSDSGRYSVVGANACGLQTNINYRIFVPNNKPIDLNGSLVVGPTIVEQPESTNAPVCGTNTFKVSADGFGNVRFQWRLDGAPLTNDVHITGVNTNILTIRQLLYSHGGNYDVVISDDCGPQNAVTSRVAVLTITPGAQWLNRTNTGPSPRYHHAMVYDTLRRVTVLFGGYYQSPTQFATYNDIWEWNGAQWLQRTLATTNEWTRDASSGGWGPAYANVPVGRAEHAMTYDPRRGRMVIFGGTAVDPAGVLHYLNDTWEWDGAQWYFRGTNGPAWRSAAGMAFNSARNVSVLFGGSYASADPAPGALWEWDGTLWKTNATVGNFAPNANTIGLAYDSFRDSLLYGPTPNLSGFIFDNFWTLRGTNWTGHSGAFNVKESATAYGSLAFDSYRRRSTYTFGTSAGVGFWDGSNWAVHTNAPAPALRFWHGSAYDPDRHVLTMFGGTFGFNQYFVSTNDTWELVFLDTPQIQQQPISQIRQLNDIATFSITAIGPGPLQYQWLRNGQPLADDFRISGATSNVLRIASVFRDDETLFQVRVSNACGSTLSRPVLLTLNPNLQLANAAGELILQWNESAAILEQANNPAGPWSPVPGAQSPFNPNFAAANKFFRLRPQ